MKIKFIGASEEEDRIVEVPDGVQTVEVQIPEKSADAWPAAFALCFVSACAVVTVYLLTCG